MRRGRVASRAMLRKVAEQMEAAGDSAKLTEMVAAVADLTHSLTQCRNIRLFASAR